MSKYWLVCIVGVISAAILALAHYVPLSTQEITSIALFKSNERFILGPHQIWKESFHSKGGFVSGIVVFSGAPFIHSDQIAVRILDEQGRERAHSIGLHTKYSSDGRFLSVTVPTTWLWTQPNEHFFAEVSVPGETTLRLRLANTPSRSDIAMSVLYPVPLSAEAQQGVLAGVFLMLCALLVSLYVPPRWQWLAAGGALAFTSIIGLAGFWFSLNPLGVSDWDYYFSLHNAYRETILHFHQLPLWNPYTCGGTAALGDPEFPLFTPTFLVELIFGIPVGLRLAIYFSIMMSGWGMLAIAKRLGLSVWGGWVAATTYMFTTVRLLELVEGHVNMFAAMWLPWLWWSFLGAYVKPTKKRILLMTLFFALIFLQGGIYLMMYTLLGLALAIILSPQKLKALRLVATAGVIALLGVAIKFIPVFLWMRQFPKQTATASTFTGSHLIDVFFGRYLHGLYLYYDQASGWHEYGAYIGFILFAVALIGMTQWKKRRVVRILIIGAAAALMISTLGEALKPFYDTFGFIPRSNISRMVIQTIIALALLAGFGIDVLRRKIRSPLLPILLIGFIAIDLLSLAYPASLQAFVLPRVYPVPTAPPAPIAYTAQTFDYLAKDTHQTRVYDAMKLGWGTFFHCSVLGPQPRAIPVESENDSRAVSTVPTASNLSITSWSPNAVTVDVTIAEQTIVAMNETWAKGWKVNGQPTVEHDGRIATVVPAGHHILNFRYDAPGYKLGAIITILTLLGIVVVLLL